MRPLKKEVRILGIDDSAFDKFNDRTVLVVGVLFRGGEFLDGVLTTRVSVDGSNSTKKLADLITKTKFRPQIQCIMIDGIAFGGFNIIDIVRLHDATGIPVIIVMRDYPDIPKIKRILKKIGMGPKARLLEKAGEIIPVYPKSPKDPEKNVHIQFYGTTRERALEFVRLSTKRGNIPEPLRVAHLIGQGIILGESRGKA